MLVAGAQRGRHEKDWNLLKTNFEDYKLDRIVTHITGPDGSFEIFHGTVREIGQDGIPAHEDRNPVYDDVDMLDVAGPFEMFDWADYDVELIAAKPGRRSA